MIQGRLIVNLDAGAVSVDDQPVHLTGKEYGILDQGQPDPEKEQQRRL